SAYTDLSISATPTAVRTAALSDPMRILRTTSGSSPAVPPEYRTTLTRPPESLFHLAAVSLRISSQDEPEGTRVAILTRMVPCGPRTATDATSARVVSLEC